MMYNTQLDTFLKVAELGSFNKAADALYITPPAVTKQINLLEEDLGVTLFVRSHRGLKLTPAGQSFCKDAKYIIDYCEASLERAKCAMIADSKVVRIGISPMTPQPLVNVWPKIQQECADIKFQLVPFFNTPENAREILKNLGQNIDVVGGILTKRCSTCASVRAHSLQWYPSAAPWHCTIRWHKRTIWRSATCTARILC